MNSQNDRMGVGGVSAGSHGAVEPHVGFDPSGFPDALRTHAKPPSAPGRGPQCPSRWRPRPAGTVAMFHVRPSGVWSSIAGMWNPLLARVFARSSVVLVVAFMFVSPSRVPSRV